MLKRNVHFLHNDFDAHHLPYYLLGIKTLISIVKKHTKVLFVLNPPTTQDDKKKGNNSSCGGARHEWP
jgi:hypothetical protein